MTDSSANIIPHPFLNGLTLFTAGRSPHRHDVHGHNAYSVIGLTSGAKYYHHQGATHSVSAFEIAVANPGELHGCGPVDNKPWSHRTWYLSEELVREVCGIADDEETPILDAPVIRDRKTARHLISAHKRCDIEIEALEGQSIALEALGLLFDNHSSYREVEQSTITINAAERMPIYLSFLQQSVSNAPDLTDLANAAGVKRNQVIRDFKAAEGVTPGQYFRSMRLNLAKQLIRAGKNLVETAGESGFSDQSHFTRSFKRAFGITPNAFKRISLQSSGNAPF
ncbi:MAG: AraC family transcriptional regulator [Pseudomonadota bacterium]